MPACSCCEMVGWAAFAPAVYKFPCPAGKARPHIGIAKGKDFAFFVDAFRNNKFEMPVPILGNGQIGNGAGMGIELCKIAAAGFPVEYFYNFHGWFFIGNVSVPGTAVADNGNIVVEINGVHFGKLAGTGNGF